MLFLMSEAALYLLVERVALYLLVELGDDVREPVEKHPSPRTIH